MIRCTTNNYCTCPSCVRRPAQANPITDAAEPINNWIEVLDITHSGGRFFNIAGKVLYMHNCVPFRVNGTDIVFKHRGSIHDILSIYTESGFPDDDDNYIPI